MAIKHENPKFPKSAQHWSQHPIAAWLYIEWLKGGREHAEGYADAADHPAWQDLDAVEKAKWYAVADAAARIYLQRFAPVDALSLGPVQMRVRMK